MHPIAETSQYHASSAWTVGRSPTLSMQTPAQPLALPALPSLQVLDVLDIGVLILDARCRVQHANPAAQMACQGSATLQLVDGQLQMTAAVHGRLQTAVQGALRGQWSMLSLTGTDAPLSVAVVPLPGLAADWPMAVALLVGGKGRPSRLALQFFKQNHGLTPAEASVLDALCDGMKPAQIASAGKVAICTVRSQISAVRNKTGARSVGHLLRIVSGLPPVARHATPHAS
jgi:DNA-binding CsgD family transcriptional regulator